jgi:methionine-gamma-lyase
MPNSFRPESLMMTHAYRPELSEGAIKPPIFQTSTFVFESAEAGKAYFELAYGLREKAQQEEEGLIYSRINNPNLEILEDRLCLWDKADACAVFESGMSAISTVMLCFLRPGDLLLYSRPTYGGTDHFVNHVLAEMDIMAVGFGPDDDMETIEGRMLKSGRADRLRLVYVETPANPTNTLIDLQMMRRIADRFSADGQRVRLAVDNTYMGPLWCSPLEHGADLVLYSATKYIGGHSDLIAGAVLGDQESLAAVRVLRTFLGNMASPHTCWLLLRSLETLKVRMERQQENARYLADYLAHHPLVERVYYLGHLSPETTEGQLFRRQYSGPGAMISFDIRGGEAEAFRLLNALRLVKLAVSLGSTESLVQHPATMTHVGVHPEERARMGITGKLIRLSVGVEHHEDLRADLEAAFLAVVAGKGIAEPVIN